MSEYRALGLKWNPKARDHIRETSWEGWRENCQAVEDANEFLPENLRQSMLPDFDIQWQMNSCTGFGGTTAVESAYIRNDGTRLNLSQMFTYTRAQFYCGMLGSDNGATIDAVRKTLTQDGVIPQESYKYTRKYYLPSREEWPILLNRAREIVVPTTSQLGSYEDLLNWVRSYGSVVMGTRWLNMFTKPGETVFDGWDTRDIGLHCWCFVGWSDRRSKDGRRFMYAVNSHPQWGVNGIAEFSPKLIDNLFADKYTDSFGVTFRGPKDPSPVGLLNYRRSRRGQ